MPNIDDIHNEIIQRIRTELIDQLPYTMHLLDLKLIVCEAVFGDEDLGHKVFDDIINQLVIRQELVLTEDTEDDPDRDFETRPGAWINVALSSGYFDKETQDFSLDESLRIQIRQIISSLS